VVIAVTVTRDGIPVRCWIFPGSDSDQRIIRTVRNDLGSGNLHRLVWVPRLPNTAESNTRRPRRTCGPGQIPR
jgi:hypothetical protein